MRLVRDSHALLLAGCLALAACAGGGAGTSPRPARPAAAAPDSAGCALADSAALADADAAIAIDATVRAERIEFREAPRAGVRVSGGRGLSCTDRTNLPRPVRPGVTYRDVRVHYRLRAALDTLAPRPDTLRRDSTARPR